MIDFIIHPFAARTCCCRYVAQASRLIIIGLLRVVVCLGAGVTSSFAVGSVETVAVGEFAHQDLERNDPDTVATLSAAVQAGLDDAHHWKFVDRQETDRVLAELALGQRGFTLSSNSVRAGKLLKADILLTGTIFTPAQAKPFIVLETTELARAEPIARQRIELGPVLKRGRLTMPSADDIRRIAQAGGKLLDETHASLAAQVDRSVIKPLFFVNASGSQRLDGSEHVLNAAIAAAAREGKKHRLLTLERSEAAAAESELVLLGLVEADLSAWAQVADYYLWGSYQERNSTGKELPEADLEVSVTVWDGRHDPVELSETGKVRELPAVADRLARKVLATTAVASRGTDPKLGTDQRKKVSAMLAARAAKLRDTEVMTDQAALATRKAALNLEQRRLLAAALFFSPAERDYWEALGGARSNRPMADSFSAELRERIRDYFGRLQILDRFLVSPDGRIDPKLAGDFSARIYSAVHGTITPSFSLPPESRYDPHLVQNVEAVEERLGAAGRAWIIRTTQLLASTSTDQEDAFLPVAAALLAETLSAPFTREEREALIASLWPRVKIDSFGYRAWYPGGDLLGDVVDRLHSHYLETGLKEKATAMERLTEAELAAAEKLPPPAASPAGEARSSKERTAAMADRERSRLANEQESRTRDFLAGHIKTLEGDIAQAEAKIQAQGRRALAFLRTHGPTAGQVATSYQNLLNGTHDLVVLPEGVSPAGRHWQATWLRDTATQRAQEGYPVAVVNRMRTRADAFDREADLAAKNSVVPATPAPAAPAASAQINPAKVPAPSVPSARGILIFNPFGAGQRAALDAAYAVKLPKRFALLPTIPLPAVAWELHDRDEPYQGGQAINLWEITKIVPWKDDLWLLADKQLWRHRPYEGDVEDIGKKLGLASRVLSLLRTEDSIWIGTEEEGVWRVDPDTLSVKRFGLQDGLQSVKAGQLVEANHFVYAIEQPPAPQVMFRPPDFWHLGESERKAVISRFDFPGGKWTTFDPFANTADHGLKVGLAYEGIGPELLLQPGNWVLNPESHEIRQPAIDYARLYKFQSPTASPLPHSIEFVDGRTIWLGSGSAILNFDLAAGVTRAPLETPPFTQIATDGHFLFCLRPDELVFNNPTKVDESPAELFVFDRTKSAWIGRAVLHGRVSTMTVGPGRLWIGRKNHPRTLLEVDLAQLTRAFAEAPDASAIVPEPEMPPSAVPASQEKIVAATSLFLAAWRGDGTTLKALLERGADPNQATASGWTPLLSAVRGGHPAAIELLLSKGAKLDVTDFRGWYPLRVAYERNDRALFDLLLRLGNVSMAFPGITQAPSPNARAAAQDYRPALESILQLALKIGDQGTVTELLSGRITPGEKRTTGNTPAAAASNANQPPPPALTAREEKNPEELKPSVECYDPRTAEYLLNSYARQGDLPTIKELFARGAPIEAAGMAISGAIDTEQWPTIDYLLAQGYDAAAPWPKVEPYFASAGRPYEDRVHPAVLILSSALLRGRGDLVEKLLQQGIFFPPQSRCGAATIKQLMRQRRYDVLGLALKAQADPNVIVLDAYTPLYEVIRAHDLAVLHLLLAAGADPTKRVTSRYEAVVLTDLKTLRKSDLPLVRSRGSATAFDLCAVENWTEGLQALLAQPNVDLRKVFVYDSYPPEPNHPYLRATLPAARAVLLSAELTFRSPTQPPGNIEFLTAIAAHDDEGFRSALKRGQSLEVRGIWHESPLMLAVAEHAPQFARALLEKGAPLIDFDLNGSTPLAYAARVGEIELVQEMVRRGANINLARGSAGRPLDEAIVQRDGPMALALLGLGADPQSYPTARGVISPLFFATRRNLPAVVQELIRRGESPRQVDTEFNLTALFPAAISNNPELIQFFLAQGVDLNQRSAEGWTPLYTAVRWGAINSVRKLVDAGLRDPQAADLAIRLVKDLNPPDRPGDEELRALPYVPDYLGSLDILQASGQVAGSRQAQDTIFWDQPHSEREIETYLASGGSVNYRGSNTPLQTACEAGDLARVKFLLAKGADANLTGMSKYYVPLSLAMDKPEMVKLLLQGGANPNTLYKPPDWVGGGAISILADAIERDKASVEAVRLLVQNGADPRLSVQPQPSAWEVLEQRTDWPKGAAQQEELRQALAGH